MRFPWKRPIYPPNDFGALERTMFQQHDRGYCLRPEPCLCDEGRQALARVQQRLTDLTERVAELEATDRGGGA